MPANMHTNVAPNAYLNSSLAPSIPSRNRTGKKGTPLDLLDKKFPRLPGTMSRFTAKRPHMQVNKGRMHEHSCSNESNKIQNVSHRNNAKRSQSRASETRFTALKPRVQKTKSDTTDPLLLPTTLSHALPPTKQL
jgi:hypothetical protein